MINTAPENNNIEKASLSGEKKINTYQNILKNKQIGEAETAGERAEAEELLTKLSDTKTSSNTKSEQKPSTEEQTPLSPQIKKAINELSRPEEVKQGIEKSYIKIENTIKESKNEKGIAGFLGRMINKILTQ